MAEQGFSTEQKKILPSHFLYPQVLRECKGVVTPVYWPDENESLWRCTCGHENAIGDEKCGGCATSRQWIRIHFDRSHLAAERLAHEQEDEAQRTAAEKKVKKAKNRSRNFRRALLLSAIFAVLAALTFCLVVWIIPTVRYQAAEALRDKGDYLAAADAFLRLGREEESDACHLLHAQKISGKEDVYALYTADHPYFRISEDGVLSVDRDGLAKSDLSFDPFIIPDVVNDILVTATDAMCFMNCDFLLSVVCPDNMTALGERSFFKCTALTSVTFPEGLTFLGERAFINCTALKSITIPKAITEVPIRLFNNCTALEEVVFKGSITGIGHYAFSDCKNLQSLLLPLTLTSVGDYAFSDCLALKARYEGTEADWQNVSVGKENKPLLDGLVFQTS